MPTVNASPFDCLAAVARHFAARPTLRAVASRRLLQLLLEHLPYLRTVQPPLTCAAPLMLDSPAPGMSWWTTQPLLDALLKAMAQGKPMAIEPLEQRDYKLGLSGPYRFPGSDSVLDTRALAGLSEPLSDLITRLPGYFAEAQVAFWRSVGGSGVSRDRWLQLLLKRALLCNLPLQALDAAQKACVRGLLLGEPTPSVFAVQVHLSIAGQVFDLMQDSLLVTGEWDERQVVLWCSPSSLVRAFESLEAFASALRDELAQTCRFDGMTWDRYQLEGDVFAQQSALVLDGMLERIGRIRYSQLEGVAGLEQLFAELSDPSQCFYSGYFIEPDVLPVVPPGMAAAKLEDNFACQQALLHLALEQLAAEGKGALDGILDLETYTRQQLDEHLRRAYPGAHAPGAEQIVLELAVAAGQPGGAAVGAGGGEPLVALGRKTLTAFAIGNLAGLGSAVIIGISRADGAALPQGLDVEAAKGLVSRVDIGASYPRYVAQLLDDRATRPLRVRRFAVEWRNALLFSGLHARLAGKLSDAGLQCLTHYCQGLVDGMPAGPSLFPLALKRRPDTTVDDPVPGMYVLLSAEPAVVMLYRPLYRHETLREFSSLRAMMDAICQEPALRQSLLEWMTPQARAIYANGGFAEPHIVSMGIDPYQPLERPAPARLAINLWRTDVNERLYVANRDLLLALADLQSTSNAESRWALLSQGAWLLFNTVTLFLSGPIASVAWLVQGVKGLEGDLQAIAEGPVFDRSAAAVDVMLNLGMLLAHLHLPGEAAVAPRRLPSAEALEGPPRRSVAWQPAGVALRQGKVGLEGSLGGVIGRQLDFTWRGNHGINWLTPGQRTRLQALRSVTPLNGLAPLASGEGEGTYRVGTQHYVAMAGDVYAVSLLEDGVRVVGTDGSLGPWLVLEYGAWRVDGRLRLQGGMPRPTTQARLLSDFRTMRRAADRLTVQGNEGLARFAALGQEVLHLQAQLATLEGLKRAEALKASASDVMIELYSTRMQALDEAMNHKRLDAVGAAQEIVRFDSEKLILIERMLQPKYGAGQQPGFEQVLDEERALLRSNLIIHNEFMLSELWRLADYPHLEALADDFRGIDLRQEKPRYRVYRQALERVVALQERMLVASGHLDELLGEAAPDLLITTASETRSVAQIAASREFTTEELRFHHVLNLADLALHLDSASGARKLAGYRASLSGRMLQSAANAHGESITANLPVADRVDILQEAWDEYAAAIINSDFVAAEGGPLVEPAMLKRYREHVQLLKDDAGRRLVEARDVLEGASGKVVRCAAYKVSSEVQHAIRNSDGVIVIATEAEEDGRSLLVVRDPLSKAVVQRFVLRNGQWTEFNESPAEAEPVRPGIRHDTLAKVQALLADNQTLLNHAQRYVEQDISGKHLSRLFDDRIALLQGVESGLAEPDAALAGMLRDGIDVLQASKVERLTELYTRTSYPGAEALQFLHGRQLIKVEYVGPRRTMADGSAFDEYRIMRLKAAGDTKGRTLWAAHFHLPSADAVASAFTRGHLKLWAQRFESNRALGSAREVVPGKRVHYGALTLAQAQGIIPF